MGNEQLDPSHIMQTATAFWGSKVLLTAVELDLFTMLGEEKFSAARLGDALGLHPRGMVSTTQARTSEVGAARRGL
jgi:hypothetical protein